MKRMLVGILLVAFVLAAAPAGLAEDAPKLEAGFVNSGLGYAELIALTPQQLDAIVTEHAAETGLVYCCGEEWPELLDISRGHVKVLFQGTALLDEEMVGAHYRCATCGDLFSVHVY